MPFPSLTNFILFTIPLMAIYFYLSTNFKNLKNKLMLQRPVKIYTKKWNKKIRFGHRGCRHQSQQIAENTKEAILKGASMGFKGVEIDIQFTKDKKIVLSHDNHTGKLEEFSRLISKLNFSQLREKRYKTGQKIATLKEALQICKENDLKMLIEIKPFCCNNEMARKLVEEIKGAKMAENVVCISFSPFPLYRIRRLEPELETCINYTNDYFTFLFRNKNFTIFCRIFLKISDFILWVFAKHIFPSFLGVTMVGPNHEILTTDDIEYFNKKDYKIFTWTVSNKHLINYYLENDIYVASDEI